MRADRVRTAAVLLAFGTLLLSGCASMPTDGAVTPVDSSPKADNQSRVRVFGVDPQKGEGPQGIVRGFLEATTSDEPHFGTARKYLTKGAAHSWDPSAGTTVLSSGPSAGVPQQLPKHLAPTNDDVTMQVTGHRIARLDDSHSYHPDDGNYAADFHLTKVDAGWRIDRLPDGLVVGRSDFERIYRPVNTFFFARLGPDADSVTGGDDVLVADPAYVRERIDPLTETVAALIDGPTDWLDPVVSTAFPAGSALADGSDLSLTDSGSLTVPLNEAAAHVGGRRCTRMAAQVLQSVQSLASSRVGEVRLTGPDGRRLCTLSHDEAQSYQPGRLNGSATHQYFVDADHRVAAVPDDGTDAHPVGGPLGSGQVGVGAIAISRDEKQGAAVSMDGRRLYVATLNRGDSLGEALLVSHAAKETDRLTAPSWDGLGDLWIADRDPQHPRLLLLRGGRETPQTVAVPRLRDGEHIESLRVSSDGVRIALRIAEPNGTRSLKIGRIERTGGPDDPHVSVQALRPVAPQLSDVESVSWAGVSQLVVVGRASGSVQQLQYVGTDGSTTNQPTLPGINDVTSVAASEDETKPLLAESQYGVFRLPPDSDWKTIAAHGSDPVYPG
jgi:lipoprotein LpqB-like beta-propeller protein/sporulation and spore germination protein